MKQLDVKVRIPMTGQAFVLWLIALACTFAAADRAYRGDWKGFAALALWAVVCTIRSMGL